MPKVAAINCTAPAKEVPEKFEMAGLVQNFRKMYKVRDPTMTKITESKLTLYSYIMGFALS